MSIPENDGAAQLRFLECWLLLGQDANSQQGWGYDAAALEALLLAAGPALRQAQSRDEAYAILSAYYLFDQRKERIG